MAWIPVEPFTCSSRVSSLRITRSTVIVPKSDFSRVDICLRSAAVRRASISGVKFACAMASKAVGLSRH